jgi:hypothetical protein
MHRIEEFAFIRWHSKLFVLLPTIQRHRICNLAAAAATTAAAVILTIPHDKVFETFAFTCRHR